MNRSVLILALLLLIMLLPLAIINGNIYISRQNIYSFVPNDIIVSFLSLLIFASFVAGIFLIRLLIMYIEKEVRLNTQDAYITSIEEIYKSTSIQRHDFNAHVQVLYGMLSENMIEDAKSYITYIYKDLRELNATIIVDRPELSSLLKAKYSTANLNKIDFDVNITCSLLDLDMKPNDLVKILNNIIDNAFEATIIHKYNEQNTNNSVKLNIFRNNNYIFIEIINPGTVENINLAFESGVTNKQGHQGLGLYIAKKITEKYSGQISIQNRDEFVYCIICFKL